MITVGTIMDSRGIPNYERAELAPLNEPEQLEPYQIQGAQVLELLHQLRDDNTILTAYFDGGLHHILSAVIAVLPEQGLLVLDYGPNEATAQRALLANRLICTARIDGVSLRFTVEGLTAAKYEGRPAISTPLPAMAYRFQRRVFFRVRTPTAEPATCRIPLQDGSDYTMSLSDVSCGGIGLLDKAERFGAQMLQEYQNCLLTLPNFGELTVTLQMRNRGHYFLRTNEKVNRFGMQFVQLPESDNLFLQRYITKLQMLAKSDD